MRLASHFRKLLEHRLLKTSGIFFLGNIANAAIPFVLLPILTRYLTPADYGIVSMFSVLVGITIPISSMSVHASITRQYYRRESLDFPNFVANALGLLVTSTVVVTLAILALREPIAALTDFPVAWVWSVPAFAALHFLVTIRLTVWQLEGKATPYAIVQVGLTLLELILALVLIVRLGMDWEGRILSRVTSAAVFALLAVALLWKGGWIKPGFNREHVKYAIKFGGPLIPHTVGMWAMTLADRVFITHYVGLEATGIYTVGAQIAMAVALITSAFASAWTPWMFEQLRAGTEDKKRKVVRATYTYAVSLFVLWASISLLAGPMLDILVGDEFQTAALFVTWLAAGQAFRGLYQAMAGYLFYTENTVLLTKITLLASGVNLVGNFVLVPRFGAIGAAQATMIAYAVYFVVTAFVARKIHPMPWGLPFGTR